MPDRTIKIKNWSSYQSYKDRRPTWIRLHKSLLDDYEFQKMSSSARAILPMLWLLASEDEDPTSGTIKKSVEEIAFRLRLTAKTIKACLDELDSNGFLQVTENKGCNGTVTEASQTEPESVTTEKRREEKNIVEFELLWNQYPNKDGKKKSLEYFSATIKNEKDLRDIKKALKNYKAHLKKETWKRPKNGSTWFYNWRDWVDWEESSSGPKEGDTRWHQREWEIFKGGQWVHDSGRVVI